MDYLLIAAVAFAASALTLFSGFGLGTLLLPAFALFVPVPLAVAATGVVHLLNNLFKSALLWRHPRWSVVLSFGLPAIPAAMAGAWLLAALGETSRLFEWDAAGRSFGPTAAGLVVGLLMIAFALLELHPRFQELRAPARLMPAGGVAVGFFGGLTGQQGALRSIFLLKSQMRTTEFIATGVVIAILVDISRLATYGLSLDSLGGLTNRGVGLILAGCLAALAGAWLGARYIEKVTIDFVRRTVAALMITLGAALAAGLIG